MERLQAIEKFQADCGYDPDRIRTVVSPLLTAWYEEVRTQQEQRIEDALAELDKVGIHALTKPATAPAAKSSGSKSSIALVFHPSDETTFKDELLKRKKAHFVLTYDSGKVITTPWDAKNFQPTSDLRNNIKSKTFWRSGKAEGLVTVEAYID